VTVLHNGALPLLLALMRMFLTRPLSFLRTFGLAWRMSRHSIRPFFVHVVYLAEACRIAPWLRAAKIQHLHTHFGTNSAEVAMMIHALGGPRWSFTIHGPKEYVDVQLFGLAEKIRDCAFVAAITSYGRSQLYRLVEHRHWPKVKVVHPGLETSLFATTGSSSGLTTRRLVCVGRICEQKGQLLLIEAAKRLAERGTDFELVLVGDGEMRGEIEALIVQYMLQDKVRITGRIKSELLHSEMLAARALVLPSFAEGLPGVIKEAMALKRPVISTFIGGIPELVRPGEHGWLVPAGDVEALVDAMQACLDTPADLLAQMGQAAHNRVLARHRVDEQAAQLEQLFESAINGHQADYQPRSRQ
jgi:colanic acid/amylovoran biosynthesis glycosyltransferase